MESVVDHFVKMIGLRMLKNSEHIQKFAPKSVIVIRLICRYLLNKGDPDGHKFGIL